VPFLDELPEFGTRVLAVMRKPIEDKREGAICETWHETKKVASTLIAVGLILGSLWP
jgi:predicted ATPase with chaperone activity